MAAFPESSTGSQPSILSEFSFQPSEMSSVLIFDPNIFTKITQTDHNLTYCMSPVSLVSPSLFVPSVPCVSCDSCVPCVPQCLLCPLVYPCVPCGPYVPLCSPVLPCVPSVYTLCYPVFPCVHLCYPVFPSVPLCYSVLPCVPAFP